MIRASVLLGQSMRDLKERHETLVVTGSCGFELASLQFLIFIGKLLELLLFGRHLR